MKRSMVMAGWVLVLAGMAWGQTTAPATRMAPTRTPDAVRSQITAHTVKNPEYEALVTKIPAKFYPPTKETTTDGAARNRGMREWDKSNLDGKPVKVTAYATGLIDAEFYIAGETPTRVQIRANGQNMSVGSKVTIEGTVGNGTVISRGYNPDGGSIPTISLYVENPKVTRIAPDATTTAPASPPGL